MCSSMASTLPLLQETRTSAFRIFLYRLLTLRDSATTQHKKAVHATLILSELDDVFPQKVHGYAITRLAACQM